MPPPSESGSYSQHTISSLVKQGADGLSSISSVSDISSQSNRSRKRRSREFNEQKTKTAKIFWLILFAAIFVFVLQQLYSTSKQYYLQGTTTDFSLENTNLTEFRIMEVCVPIDRMLHSTWRFYNLTPAAARYLQQQWFAYAYDSQSLDYAVQTEDLYVDPDVFYLPYSDVQPNNSWNWDQIRQHLQSAMAQAEQELAEVIEFNPNRYSWSVRRMFDISSSELFNDGSFLPIAVQTAPRHGPYASPGEPHIVCWDIEAEPAISEYNKWQIRVWADQDIDGGLWLFYFTQFYGDADVFPLSSYFPIEYPDREYATKELWYSFTSEVNMLRMLNRRTYHCDDGETQKRQRLPNEYHKTRCMTDCQRRHISLQFNCSFKTDDLKSFCHQHHFLKVYSSLPLDEWLDFFTTEELKTTAKLLLHGDLKNVFLPGNSHTSDRSELMVALMFRQTFINFNSSCSTECKDELRNCDIHKFYPHFMAITPLYYKHDEKGGSPSVNLTGHGSVVKAYDVHIQVNIEPVYSIFGQIKLMQLEDYVSNIGGLSGFYLGASVLSLVHVLVYWVVEPFFNAVKRRRLAWQARRVQNQEAR